MWDKARAKLPIAAKYPSNFDPEIVDLISTLNELLGIRIQSYRELSEERLTKIEEIREYIDITI